MPPGLRERVSGFMGEGTGVTPSFRTRINVDTLSMSRSVFGGKGGRLPGKKRQPRGRRVVPAKNIAAWWCSSPLFLPVVAKHHRLVGGFYHRIVCHVV